MVPRVTYRKQSYLTLNSPGWNPQPLDKLRKPDVTTLPLISGSFAPVINDIRRIFVYRAELF